MPDHPGTGKQAAEATLHPAVAALLRAGAFPTLVDYLPAPGQELAVGGATGSLPLVTLAALSVQLPSRLWVLVAPSGTEAGRCHDDLATLLGPGAAVNFPEKEARDTQGVTDGASGDPAEGERIEAVEALLAGDARILVATARALQEVAAIPEELAELRVTVAVGDELRPDDLVAALEDRGFVREGLVEEVGCYAVRGGIVDLFSYGAAGPVRIEFWGDEVESIRRFGVLDQLSTDTLDRIDILPVRFEAGPAGGAATRSSILERLPLDSIVVHPSGQEWELEAQEAWQRVVREQTGDRFEGKSVTGGDESGPKGGSRAPDAASALLHPGVFTERVASHPRLSFAEEHIGDLVLRARRPPRFERNVERLRSYLDDAAERGEESWILCDNEGQVQRLEELLADRQGNLPSGCQTTVGSTAGGFVLEDSDPTVNVLTDHEIFDRSRGLRRIRRFRGAAALESLAQLSPGDHIVHMEHGIGRFRGLERLEIGGESLEALVAEYDGGEVLRVPVHSLDQVERWVGAHPGDEPDRLHRIGGRRWKRLRGRTEAAINRMTAELVDLYAQRRTRPGHAFPPDTRWQREMESAFLYEDTRDQRTVVEEIKRDMEEPRTMDRLVCGDAGYGKTEVAIRAAFKAVQDGKQVAVLAPTTVLVAQHLKTFGDRLADYPVVVASLSRFDRPREQRETLRGLAEGTVDIVIGTHRLLSGDVAFRDLGLVVVDEEQRLGVRQKERLKRLRTTVDVLTLSATPIPRTLYLSLSGIRDLSVIRTPPRDRMAIVTHMIEWSDQLIAEACRRELDRGGQVFFLHNRVATIGAAAERVARLLPGATVEVAHGQMAVSELDRAMTRFVAGRTDILVCSSIIENGLDVANANTLIVTRADRFGLAQLYQIRGRVGRWDRRAYCYLVVPESLTPEAERRLRVLEHYTELGSGYQIALRDLEVRGAGNLLGEDQSGFAHAVGIDTYMRLLEQAARRLEAGGSRRSDFPAPEVSVETGAYLPDSYVADTKQKLHLYRRLSAAKSRREVEALTAEIADRFGRLPAEARSLLAKALLAVVGKGAGAERISVRNEVARVGFWPEATPRISALEEALMRREATVDVPRLAPLSLVFSCGSGESLVAVVADALEALGGGGDD